MSQRPELLAELRARSLSASSLELWIACPARWFVERMLRPAHTEPDAEPLVRGGLAHAVLRDTLAGLREQTGSARLTQARLGPALALLEQALARHQAAFPLSERPERVPGARRRLRADLERYLRHAASSGGALEPTHFELGFGFDGDEHALPALELGAGLRLRGRIDRIDIGPHGEAVVYDYKGAAASPAARWAADGKVQMALYMRAAQELLGLRVVGGFYQPLAGTDLRPRGVLDADAGLELDCVRTDRVPRERFDELIEGALGRARRAAAALMAGAIAPQPSSCTYQGGCAHPAICRCAR